MRQKQELATRNQTTGEVNSVCSEHLSICGDLSDVYTPTVHDVRNAQGRSEHGSTNIDTPGCYLQYIKLLKKITKIQIRLTTQMFRNVL